jgi:hypothetical protein
MEKSLFVVEIITEIEGETATTSNFRVAADNIVSAVHWADEFATKNGYRLIAKIEQTATIEVI